MFLRFSSQRISSFITTQSYSRSSICSNHRPLSNCIHTLRSRPGSSSRKAAPRVVKFFHASAPSNAPKDPYAVLGVKKDATAAEIKKVYFSLARKYHPDTNPDTSAKTKFVEIQEAYDVLKDEKKRAAYDAYGSASQQPGFDPNAFSGANNPFNNGGFSAFGDLFNSRRSQQDMFDQLFGVFSGAGGSQRSGRNVGEHLQASISISFMDACKGTSRVITITPVVNCGTCHGTGLKAGAKRSTCASCGGSGTRTFMLDNGFHMASTCTACQGSGSTVPHGSHCGDCSGQGQVRIRKSVKVDIPAGVEDGMTIRVPGAGDASLTGKGQAGDLHVRVSVASSKIFRRQGVNLHHDIRIPLQTALLGGKVRVPTLDGEVDVRIPGGTQPGEEMVLKGRGVKSVLSSSKGDLFVSFQVQLPRSLTKKQREILQQYADDVEGRTSPAENSGAQDQASGQESRTSTESQAYTAPKDENDANSHSRAEDRSASSPKEEDRRKRATA